MPSTRAKLKDLIEEYNEENGVTSPSQVVDRFDNNDNVTDKYYTTVREDVVVTDSSNDRRNKSKYAVTDDKNGIRRDTQDWMARMRKIEDKNKR